MTRKFFTCFTAALTLLAGCGSDAVEGDTGGASSSGSTGGGSSTTATTPPTTGETGTSTTGESGTSSTGEPTTEPPTTTEPATTTTTTEPATSSTTDDSGSSTTDADTGTSTGDESGDPVAQCLMMIDPGDACGECACTTCTTELQDCQADEGCTAIRMCAQESGCGGLDCLGPCGDTINKYGGFAGPSANKAITLGMCIEGGCARQCAG